jgi:hypothetical protein
MKKSHFSFLVFAVCFLVLSAVSSEAADNSLDVIIHDQVLPSGMGGGWTRSGNKHNRYVTLQQVVKKALKKQDYSGEIKFMQFGANLPDNPNQLFITVERWEEAPYSMGRSISVDFVMSVKLRLEDEEIELGRFSGRDSHMVTGGGDAVEDFGPAAARAFEQAIDFYNDSAIVVHEEWETGPVAKP